MVFTVNTGALVFGMTLEPSKMGSRESVLSSSRPLLLSLELSLLVLLPLSQRTQQKLFPGPLNKSFGV
jgi:hypothetical protein